MCRRCGVNCILVVENNVSRDRQSRYYRFVCTHCCGSVISDVMSACDDYSTKVADVVFSDDDEFIVFDEEFVRGAVRER